MEGNLRSKVISGLAWKFGERILAQLVSIVVSIVLARLLMPEDYGAVALVMTFITIANVFVVNGFGSALIQKKDATDTDFSTVFYINLVFSFIIYFVLFLIAPLFAHFYNLPVLEPATRVLALRIPIAAVNSIQQAYVSKNMLFKRFFFSTLFGTAISGVVGIWMAYLGYGVWALVAQYLTNVCVDTIVLWVTVKWHPIRAFSFISAKELIIYGWKLLAAGLLDTGYNELRTLLIGKVYSSYDLAYYNQGDKYPKIIVININSAISSVLFPVLSTMQEEKARVKYLTRKSIQVSSYVMWPMMLGLAVIAEPLVKLLLTEKWISCVPYLCIFCISYGMWPIHTANLEALKAIGRSDLFLKLEITKKIIGLIALIISLQWGPIAIAVSLIVSGIIAVFVNGKPNTELLEYSFKEQILDLLHPFLIAVLMAALIYPLRMIVHSDVALIIASIVYGALVYALLSMIFKPEGFVYLRLLLLKNN